MHRLFPVLAALGLSACSSVLTEDTALVSSPGRFEGHGCAELVKLNAQSTQRERELVVMMARASSDPTGPVVNWLVYSSPLATERGNLRRIQEAATAGRCDLQSGKVAE